jgi:hypothetical protein
MWKQRQRDCLSQRFQLRMTTNFGIVPLLWSQRVFATRTSWTCKFNINVTFWTSFKAEFICWIFSSSYVSKTAAYTFATYQQTKYISKSIAQFIALICKYWFNHTGAKDALCLGTILIGKSLDLQLHVLFFVTRSTSNQQPNTTMRNWKWF